VSFVIILVLFFVGGVLFELARSWGSLAQQWRTTRDTESAASAERILKDRKRVLASEEPPALADTREFSFRGFEYYDRAQAAFEALGFTMLGDFALDHAAWMRPGARTFLRCGRSRDREVVCSIIDATRYPIGFSAYEKVHFYLGGGHRRNLKGISLRTELTDGRFLITSTDIDIAKEEQPPEVSKETMPVKTSAAELLERHRGRVARAIAGSGVSVVPIGTVEEHGQSWVRHSRIARAWREKIGYALTQKEQRDFVESSSPLNRDMADSMIESMRAMEDRERRRAS